MGRTSRGCRVPTELRVRESVLDYRERKADIVREIGLKYIKSTRACPNTT